LYEELECCRYNSSTWLRLLLLTLSPALVVLGGSESWWLLDERKARQFCPCVRCSGFHCAQCGQCARAYRLLVLPRHSTYLPPHQSALLVVFACLTPDGGRQEGERCCGCVVVRRCGALRQTSVYLVLFARSLFSRTSSPSCISLLYTTTIYAGSCWCHLLLQHIRNHSRCTDVLERHHMQGWPFYF
jgi:hypothetical protein